LKEKKLKSLVNPDFDHLETVLRQGLPRTSKVHCAIVMCKHFGVPKGLTIYESAEKHLPVAEKLLILLQAEKLVNCNFNISIASGESREEIAYVS